MDCSEVSPVFVIYWCMGLSVGQLVSPTVGGLDDWKAGRLVGSSGWSPSSVCFGYLVSFYE
jgi:hypothetical protein